MSSYFTSILAKAQEIVSSATETAIDYVIDNPTTSALATATTAIGGTYLLRSSQLYQRHSTVINSIGVLTAVGGAYLGYSTVRPYLANLMKAKEVLEKSNSKRMILSQEQLTAIDQTNIQSWVVTLDALRNSLVDTYNVDALFATINSVREKQRQLKLSDPKPLMPIFNHYRIHIFSRLVSSIVLTAAVRYFNGISVPVTFRYAELDRNLFDSTCLNDQQITQLTELEAKYANYQADRQNNEKLTPEEAHLMHKFQTEFNSPSDGTFLRTLAQSAVTDVLNLVYQSTLTVLFPVVCQIVTAQLMTNDTPFSFSQIVQEYQAGKRVKDDLNTLGYEKGEFFLESDSWISATLTSQDLMLCIERATVKAMNVLIQPSEWFIRVELDNDNDDDDDDNNNFDTTDTNPIAPAAQSMNSTRNKQKQPKCSTMPISDYILGYGYGNYQNATLREHNASRSGFTLLTPTEIDALHTHAVNMLDLSLLTTQHTASQTQSAQLTHGEYHSTQKSPQPPQFFPNIDYKSLTYMPTIHQSLPQPVPSTTTPLPLLSHLLLPLGPLLHSILQRLNELQSQPLRIYPSSLSIISSQQPLPVQQSSLQQNPLSDMFGIVTGTAGSSQQQPQQSQQNERLITVDSKEIYTRRVLQVIGELHGIMMCTQHQFIDPKSTPTEVAKSVHPASSSSTTSTSSSATSAQNGSSSDPLGLWDESLDGENNNVDHINIQLHPWHYTTTPSPPSTDSSKDIVSYPTDSEHTLEDLETNLQEYPFFNEIWKDITLLLNHVGTLLYQQSTPSAAGNGGKTQAGTSSAPIRQLTSIIQETPSNALVMTKRVAQLFDTLLPSLEQAQVQQQQQLALQRNKQQTPQQQHYANMLLVPQSYAFNLIMTNHHRKYVLDTMMKTIASQIGQEKRGGGDFMDLLGFGSEELGMLQSLLGGGDAGGDDDLKNMLSLLNPGADLGPSSSSGGKSGKSADVGGSAPLSGLPGGSEDEQLMQLLSALGGGGDSGFSGAGDLSALLGGPPTPSTRIPAAGKAKKTATGKGAKKATPVVKKAAATTNTNTDTSTTTPIAQSPPPPGP